MEPKPWYESRSMWLGIITAVVGYLAIAKNADGTPLLPPDILPWVTIASGLLATFLRPQSTTPIKPLA